MHMKRYIDSDRLCTTLVFYALSLLPEVLMYASRTIWYDMIWYNMVWYDMTRFAHLMFPLASFCCRLQREPLQRQAKSCSGWSSDVQSVKISVKVMHHRAMLYCCYCYYYYYHYYYFYLTMYIIYIYIDGLKLRMHFWKPDSTRAKLKTCILPAFRNLECAPPPSMKLFGNQQLECLQGHMFFPGRNTYIS